LGADSYFNEMRMPVFPPLRAYFQNADKRGGNQAGREGRVSGQITFLRKGTSTSVIRDKVGKQADVQCCGGTMRKLGGCRMQKGGLLSGERKNNDRARGWGY